ncbi:MAG: dienelactone hydrolase family protein [Bacteroidota bacterium]
MIQKIKNTIVQGAGNKPMATDIFFEENGIAKPVVIYAHGFNGFKDWGNFDLIAERFVSAGFVFIKFNFSHNGTTPEQPEIFADLEAFGQNNYTRQLEDLGFVIDWVCDAANPYIRETDTKRISLIGHSMGGGISIIKSSEDNRIKNLVTWAAVSENKTPWGNWPAEKMNEWKQTGVAFYVNGRTGQNMPLYYQLHEDYEQHNDRLNIQQAIGRIRVPVLICHGTLDPAVPVASAYKLADWQPSADLFTVESDHVFGRSHPWSHPFLPPAMEAVLMRTFSFLS